MVVSLNSSVGFTSTADHQKVPRVCIGASILKANNFSSPSRTLTFSKPIHTRNVRPHLVANGDQLATEASDRISESTQRSISNKESSATSETETVNRDPEATNGSMLASEKKQDDASNVDMNAVPKRSKLTAREKLRAARVRSRYSEPKPVKTAELGSNVLEALRETDKTRGKKRSGLPEAPTNLFDDSKRGMPKKGLTFELPVGWDVFLIILSVVVISTVMFTTTYIVWKVGAIHFNEY